jgi:alkyl hydroperoxide reductase subunit AhpC
MSLRIGSTAPDFEAETTQGRIHFHDWIGDSWAVLFSHPKDYTPVCTTELGEVARLKPEFDRRNTKVIGLSVDKVSEHSGWANDIRDVSGHEVSFPMIGDYDLTVSKLYNMLPEDEANTEGRTAATNATVRTVYLIGPDKKIKAMLIYPMSSGRNFQEILRLLDSIQLTAQHPIATPVNWNPGDDCIVAPSLSDEQAKEKFGSFKTVKPYLRTIPQPASASAQATARAEPEKQPA